jgi:hypothetical protein
MRWAAPTSRGRFGTPLTDMTRRTSPSLEAESGMSSGSAALGLSVAVSALTRTLRPSWVAMILVRLYSSEKSLAGQYPATG